jgi:hypothetical protein
MPEMGKTPIKVGKTPMKVGKNADESGQNADSLIGRTKLSLFQQSNEYLE